MKRCGIELKSNQAILVVMNENEYIDLKVKKLTLEEDEDQENIRQFCHDFLYFLEENHIEEIVIKKRAKKGTFAGGVVTFKMEGLIQLNPKCKVQLISPQAVSSFERKNSVEFPSILKKYQEQAYLTLLSSI